MTQIIDRRNRVTVRTVRPRVVKVPGGVVARIADMRGRVQPRPAPVNAIARPVNPRTIIENRAAPGKDGQNGADGAGNIAPISYSFGDAPRAIYVPDKPGTVTLARVVPTNPFNGSTPTLQVGTMADLDSIFPAAFSNLKDVAETEITPDVHLDANEAIVLTITPAGATQGNGRIFLAFVPDGS